MINKVLFVDDEKNVLEAIRRQLWKKIDFDLALGPQVGLEAVKQRGPYAVIVSDLHMPVMDGIQFLSRTREIAPDTIRMVLTGNADLNTAIDSVNEGNIFRFLTKPCAEDVLIKVIKLGLEQYRLVTAERELLEKTLKGSIEVMTELLSLANPEAFGRALRVKRYVVEIAKKMEIPDIWRLETAAMLSQIGWLLLTAQTLQKFLHGKDDFIGEEKKTLGMIPTVSADLINNIPRMNEVADIILYQDKHFDGSGQPDDGRRGADIPLGSRILKVALDFDLLESRGIMRGEILAQLQARTGWYDIEILGALEKVIGIEKDLQVMKLQVFELRAHMILDQDVRSSKDQLLISKGQELSEAALKRLRFIHENSGVQEPIRVFSPT